MRKTRYKNAYVFDSDSRSFVAGDFSVQDGEFVSVCVKDNGIDSDIVDLGGAYVIPGLVDIHTHGRNGFDFNRASADEMKQMKRLYAESGVTTVVPTLASDTFPNMKKSVENIEKAGFSGVHIEGRYLNPKRRGAHNPALLASLNPDELCELAKAAGKMHVHISAAFELDKTGGFLKKVTELGWTASLGHTDATYEEATDAIKRGVKSFTHTFNCMPQIHHRNGGAAAAALTSDAYAEFICDGLHLSKETVLLASKAKEPDRIILITDSMEGTGCPDGEFSIAGQRVFLNGGKAYTEDGAIAGSTLELFDGLKNFAEFSGISFEKAVNCATKNPCDLLGLEKVGRIKKGYKADFIILDGEYRKTAVYKDGERII